MVPKTEPVRIDLSHFKLHIRIMPGAEPTLHFDSPSRRFYLAVIALVVNQMKQLGRVASIPMQAHFDTLALLNETVGKVGRIEQKPHTANISQVEGCAVRLAHGHLFKMAGQKKVYANGDMVECLSGYVKRRHYEPGLSIFECIMVAPMRIAALVLATPMQFGG